jgi:LysR family glycine cleavage system transcriptional activator
LTPRGLQLRDDVTVAFLKLSESCERARHRSPATSRVRLSAPPAFSVRWLIPRLSEFQRLYPGIDVSLSNSVAAPEFVTDEYDLAIRRFDRLPLAGCHAVPLFPECSVPVCHVDLIGRRALPMKFQDLVGSMRLVRVAGEPRGWAKWAKAWQHDLSQARFVDVELTYLAVQAALEGLGSALFPLALARDDIARGILALPLGMQPLDASRYCVVSDRPPRRGSAVARMIEWLQSESLCLDPGAATESSVKGRGRASLKGSPSSR